MMDSPLPAHKDGADAEITNISDSAMELTSSGENMIVYYIHGIMCTCINH